MNTRQMPKLLRRIRSYLAGLALLAFFVLVFMGIFNCTNPIMQSQMSTGEPHSFLADCMPGENCGMDLNKHIEIWQAMITTDLNTSFSGLVASLIIGFFVVGICKRVWSPQIFLPSTQYLYYDRDHRESKLYNYFIHIFSSGILQPKLFA